MDNNQKVSKFWSEYVDSVRKGALSQREIKHNVMWVERYIDFHQGLKLLAHSSTEMDGFFQDLGRKTRLKDWQLRQAVKALRTLFVEQLKCRLAVS